MTAIQPTRRPLTRRQAEALAIGAVVVDQAGERFRVLQPSRQAGKASGRICVVSLVTTLVQYLPWQEAARLPIRSRRHRNIT